MKNLNIFSLISEYDSAKSGGVLNVPNVSFVDEDSSVRYLLKLDFTHNGYEYVDLGLPSGLKWATCNVGATSPEQAGLYFAWGETTGYTADQVESGVRAFTEDEYNAGPAASISADLILEQDAARANMGGNWRMPTQTECQELLDNCDGALTDDYNGTGVTGRLFTSKVNGKSVFFPYAGFYTNVGLDGVGSNGHYWSASWDNLYDYAWEFNFFSGYQSISSDSRNYGHSVRAVCE